MIQPNPVQEAVMAQWGITPIIAEGEAPSDALLTFLRALRRETGVTMDE
jgi:hypothetical protein